MSSATYDVWAATVVPGTITQEEANDLKAYLQLLATTAGKLNDAAKDCGLVKAAYDSAASAVLVKLGGSAVMPNPTSLGQTGDLTQPNVVNNLQAYMTTVAALDTSGHKENLWKAAGLANMAGFSPE